MNNISKIIKESLVESNNINLTSYLDDDGLIDITNINKLPKEIINNICWSIIDNCIEIDREYKEGYKSFSDYFFLIPKTKYKPDDIYLKTINEQAIDLSFHVDFEFDLYPGQEGDYDTEPIGESLIFKNAVISDVILEITDNNKIEIKDKDIIEALQDLISNDYKLIDEWEVECLEYYNDYGYYDED